MILAVPCMILLSGCGDVLSGSATGQDVNPTEDHQQELAAITRDLEDLNTYYSGLEFRTLETLVFARNLLERSEEMAASATDADPVAVLALDESIDALWRIESSIFDLLESRERTIGEVLNVTTENLTSALASYPSEGLDEFLETLANQEAASDDLLDQLFDIDNKLMTMDLTPMLEGQASLVPATPTPVPSPTPPLTPMPPGSYLAVHSDEQYQGWITGDYYPCTSTPCGHLDVTTWYGGEIYVRISGQSTDPLDDWYWAYIYKHSESTWVIQYVTPVLDVWSPHNGLDESEPWMGDWGKGMTVDLISP